MHTKHEGKEAGVITMTLTGGLFILGKLISGNKLTDPRIFNIIEDGKRIMLSPLPGTPPFITIGIDGLRYSILLNDENKGLLDLYDQVTHPQIAPNIVIPGRGKVLSMN
jgi:hypothetical protein